MCRNILVPVDLSDRTRAARARAAELASGQTLTLLHVIETLRGVQYDELQEFYGGLSDRAQAVLETWSKQLAEAGVTVKREIVFGKRGPEIIRFARENDSDLIVLASHRPTEETAVEQLGTISHQVALFAPCSVLLVR